MCLDSTQLLSQKELQVLTDRTKITPEMSATVTYKKTVLSVSEPRRLW